MIGRFFAGVGALLWSPSDETYLVLRRTADKDFGAGSWECVTGRVDQGEGFVEAVHREVREELGLEVVIDFIVGTIHFYRGRPTPENELVGLQFCCSAPQGDTIALSWEHTEHRWIAAEEAESLLPAGYWLRDAILRAEAIRKLMPAGLLAYNRVNGFEL